MTPSRLRALLLFALVLAAAVNVHGLVLNLRAHARLRDSVYATVRARVGGIRAALGQRIALGAGADRETVLRQAAADGGWESVEVVTAEPAAGGGSPNGRPLGAADAQALRAGAVLVRADPASGGGRLIAYALVGAAAEPLVLRFASASPALAEDRREREQVFLGPVATLLVLLLAGGLALVPRPDAGSAPPRALIAYEEAMERLRDRGDHLEDVLRDKEALARAGELTAGMVHEVRNGLGTILGYARLAESAPQQAAESARLIREECDTLERVVRRFMDFVKRETLATSPMDLAAMLKRVAERESRPAGAAVSLDLAGAGTIVADETLLERAFENLVRNARESSGPAGHVWVSAARDGDTSVVTVADDGPGFPPSVRAALRPFFTTKAGGLGLGLAIALKIVRLHGGQLEIGSRLPRGGAVTVRLPAAGPAGGRTVTEGIVESAQPPGATAV